MKQKTLDMHEHDIIREAFELAIIRLKEHGADYHRIREFALVENILVGADKIIAKNWD